MWPSSSGEQSRAIDKLPEDIMLFHSPQSLQAEIAYRQERLRRDYQRPWWFHRKPKAVAHRAPSRQAVQARHAM
ncbi:hypothetical protein GCM10009744_23190 [Kribbella alba]|uniref:Integrase n=1 Tax=Kribbella alba TaxID=190197 RepID=A0ABN2F7B1_9ACTN